MNPVSSVFHLHIIAYQVWGGRIYWKINCMYEPKQLSRGKLLGNNCQVAFHFWWVKALKSTNHLMSKDQLLCTMLFMVINCFQIKSMLQQHSVNAFIVLVFILVRPIKLSWQCLLDVWRSDYSTLSPPGEGYILLRRDQRGRQGHSRQQCQASLYHSEPCSLISPQLWCSWEPTHPFPGSLLQTATVRPLGPTAVLWPTSFSSSC